MEFEQNYYIDPSLLIPLTPEFSIPVSPIEGSQIYFSSDHFPGVIIEFTFYDFRESNFIHENIVLDRPTILINVMSADGGNHDYIDKFIPRCIIEYSKVLSTLVVDDRNYILISKYSKNRERIYRKICPLFKTIEEIGIRRKLQEPKVQEMLIWFHTQ